MRRAFPWMQFYPADWLADSVTGCSLAAQGLWINMLCIMHLSQRYGYLESEDKAIPDELLSRRCGCVSVEEYRNLLAELFSAGVPSRTAEGTIFNRRMVRDQEQRDGNRDRQKRHREKRNAPVTPSSREETRDERLETRKKRNLAAKPAPPVDSRYRPFFDFAYGAYKAKNGQPPTWKGREGKTMSSFLKENAWVTSEEWQKRFSAYLESTDRYTANKGDDSLLYFVVHFDLYRDGPVLEKKGASNGSTKKLTGDDLTAANLKAAGFTH